MAATNCPWDIDDALRRRMEKRVYVPLPSVEGRKTMLQNCMKGVKVGNIDWEEIAARLDGYSGADISSLCRECAMAPLREVSMTWLLDSSIDQQDKYRMLDTEITQQHFTQAIKNVKKSVGDTKRFEDWNKQYGAV